jgi:hypothetical protein
MDARTAKRIHDGSSVPGRDGVVIHIPIPIAKKSPMAEDRKKTTELSRAWVLCAAISSAKTKVSGLRRTTIPMEKESARV